jgi:lipoprotein NlpD
MNQFSRSIAIWLLSVCLADQWAWAQIKITGPGFTADPNGFRSDDPEPTPQRFAAGSTVKDCAECPELVVIPGGSFEMGSSESSSEQPIHRVNISSFLMGKTEITQRQWTWVMDSNPSSFSRCGENCPVESVSWKEAQEFARRLSKKTGIEYRLPTEAEWEYAARAGTNTKWSFGDDQRDLIEYAWTQSNSGLTTHPVAKKKANAFGLYDMYGNVWEWTQDCWNADYYGAPKDGGAWESGECSRRVLRGDSWGYLPSNRPGSVQRFESRTMYGQDHSSNIYGLRIARTLTQTPSVVLKAKPENAEKAGYYTVRPGDTMARIGQKTGQNYHDIARWSGLENPNKFEVGQVLRILPLETNDTSPPLDVPAEFMAPKGVATLQAGRAKELAPNGAEETPGFVWPASGQIISRFDESKNQKGIDIGGVLGAPIIAAAYGKVVYAGAGLRGYGNLIIIKHSSTFLTAYAHNQAILVKLEETVNTGQQIATMGNSDADGVKLHFEIRRMGKVIDPMELLPNLASPTKK